LKAASGQGAAIVLCSGRMLPTMDRIAQDLLDRGVDANFVCCNGAVVMGQSKLGRPLVWHRPVAAPAAELIIDFANARTLCLQLYFDRHVYARCTTEEHWELTRAYRAITSCTHDFVDSYDSFRGRRPDKILVMTNDVDGMYDALAQHEIGKVAHLIKGFFFVEVLDPQVNKLSALNALCDHLQVKLSEVIGFGDGDNDQEFLEGVGLGIAMQNATPATKQRARKVSPFSHTDDAVARELEQLIVEGALGPTAAN